VASAFVDLLLTPGRSMFSFGAASGWKWFLPPAKLRITLGGIFHVRKASVALWLSNLLCLGSFIAGGPDYMLRIFVALHTLWFYEDFAFWSSHLNTSLTFHALLCDAKHFDAAIVFCFCRLWFFSGVGKLFPAFVTWHTNTLFNYSPLFAAALRRLGTRQQLEPYVRVWARFGGISETAFPILLLCLPPVGFLLCAGMHAYISLGLYAPLLWNVQGVQMGWFVLRKAYDGSIGSDIVGWLQQGTDDSFGLDIVHLLTCDCWTSPATMGWFILEILFIVLIICSNIGCRPLNGMFDSNIHGGNFTQHHVFVRRNLVPSLLGAPGPPGKTVPGMNPEIGVWTVATCPFTDVRFAETFRLAAPSADASEYALIPMLMLFGKVPDTWWFGAQVMHGPQHFIVAEYVRMWSAGTLLQADDVIVVRVPPLTWLQKRHIARVF